MNVCWATTDSGLTYIARMPQYHGHLLISLAYNLAWSKNKAEEDRLREVLSQIEPQPAAVNEPTEAELSSLNIDLPSGAFLKVSYLIDRRTPEDAATVLRRVVHHIESQNQPTWWFVNMLPIDGG